MATISVSHSLQYLHPAIIVDGNYNAGGGEQTRLEDLYASHRDFIYRVALRVIRNTDDAEDAVQNVFLRMMRNGRPPDVGSGAAAYWRRAAVNAAIDVIRKRTQRAEIGLPPSHPAAEQRVMERHHVRQVIGKLPPESAELFELHYHGGYSYEELARHFGIQVGAVKSRLYRIRAALQKEMQGA